MKLSDGVEQAIHAMLVMAALEADGVLSAAALAEFHGVSPSYLLKHLQALSGAGLVVAVPGPKGGYRLARAARDITLLDVVQAVEGKDPAFRCAEIRQRGPSPLPAKFFKAPCAVNAAMLRAEQAWRTELRRTRLSDLFAAAHTPLGAAIDARVCAFRAVHERRQGQ